MKLRFLTTIIFCIILTNSFAQSSKQIVEQVLAKSGSKAMFEQLDAMLESKIAEKKTTFSNENDFNKFSSAMKSGFSSTNAVGYYIEYFVKYVNEDSLKTIIKLYDNQLMQEMTKLEEQSNLPSKQQEMQTFFAGMNSNPPSQQRIQSLVRLNNTVGASEMTVKLIENMIFSMAKGANMAQPKEKQTSQEELDKNLKNMFPESFKQQMTNQLIAAWLFTYRDVDNDKLNKYIEIWETPTAKYFSKASLVALDYTFSKLGQDVGVSLGTFVK